MKTFTQFFLEIELPKDGQWITTKSGKHIFVSKDGKMLAGIPKELIGKDISELKDINRYLDKSPTKEKNIKNISDFAKESEKSAFGYEAHEHCRIEKATKVCLDALAEYTYQTYTDINTSLRTPEKFKDQNKDKPEKIDETNTNIKNLRTLFDENKSTKDVTVFRGLMSGAKRLQDLKPGDIFIDKGFMSTTTNTDISSGFSGRSSVQMKILVPKGSRAISALEVTKYPDLEEDEILLGDNSNLKFVGLEDDGVTYCFQLVN